MSAITDYLAALTIRQPWADLILSGVKDVENRSWQTRHRGKMLIHGARAVDWEGVERLQGEGVLPEGYVPSGTGAILGVVELVDCLTSHPSRFFVGPYGLSLRSPWRLADSVPYRGQLGIFKVPSSAVPELAS